MTDDLGKIVRRAFDVNINMLPADLSNIPEAEHHFWYKLEIIDKTFSRVYNESNYRGWIVSDIRQTPLSGDLGHIKMTHLLFKGIGRINYENNEFRFYQPQY